MNALTTEHGRAFRLSKLRVRASLYLALAILFMVSPVNARVGYEQLVWQDLEEWDHARGQVTSTTVDHADWHAVSLAPGAAVSYQIPAKAFVRLYSEKASLPDQVSVAVGDGHGLFRETRAMQLADHNYLLAPEQDVSQLLIENKASDSISLSILISEFSPEQGYPHKTRLLAPEDATTLVVDTSHLNSEQDFWLLMPDQALNYTVNGPAFIELESMLVLTDNDETLPSYHLNATLDGQPAIHWQHQAAVAPFYRRIEGQAEVLSQLALSGEYAVSSEPSKFRTSYMESAYLQIPKGQHNLRLRSLRPVLARVFAKDNWGLASNADFLYPQQTENEHASQAYQTRLQAVLESIQHTAPSIDLQVLSAWLASAHPIDALSERIITRQVFYRTLPASALDSQLNLLGVRPFLPAFTHEQEQEYGADWVSVEAQQPDDGLSEDQDGEPTGKVPEAYVQSIIGKILQFNVPKHEGRSQLRMRTTADVNTPAEFVLRYQDGTEQRITFRPAFRDSRFWHRNHQKRTEAWTPNFSTEAGTQVISQVYLDLPPHVSGLSLQQLSGAPMTLQLGYSTVAPRTESDTERTSLLAMPVPVGSALGLAKAGSEDGQKDAPFAFLMQPALAELRQRLHVRARQFQESLPVFPALETSSKVPNQWREQVDALTQRGEWATALELLAPLTRHQDRQIRKEASKRRLELLLRAGEPMLYEHSLLELFARTHNQAETAELSNYAENALLTWYKHQQRWLELEKFSARRFMDTGNLSYLQAFQEALIGGRQLELSDQLAALLGHHGSTKQPAWQRFQPQNMRAASSLLIHSQEMDAYSQRYTANADAALSFQVEGPVRLEFRVRPVLKADASQAEDNWLQVRTDQEGWWLPMHRSSRSENLVIVGTDQGLAAETVHQISLGAGQHHLAIRPAHGQVAISLSHYVGEASETLATELQVYSNEQHEGPVALALPTRYLEKTIELEAGSHFWEWAEEAPQQAVLRLLWQLEQQAKPDLSLIAAGNRIIQQQATGPVYKDLQRRLNRSTIWHLEDQIIDSAGIRYIEFASPPLISAAARIRQSLLPPLDEGSLWLSEQRDVTLQVTAQKTVSLRIGLRHMLSPLHQRDPAEVVIWLNDAPVSRLELQPDNHEQFYSLSLPAGEHQLRVELQDPLGHEQVVLRAEQLSADGKRWQALTWPTRRSYFVSQPAQAVKLYARAHQWLRIDEYSQGETVSRYHYQNDNGLLTLAPGKGEQERLLRIYSLSMAPPENAPSETSAPARVAEQAGQLWPKRASDILWQHEDILEPGEQNEGTWGAYVSLTDRSFSEDEDFARTRQSVQLGHHYRRHDPLDRRYWLSDTFLRSLASDGQTVGTEQQLVYVDAFNVWQLAFTARAQYFMAAPTGTDDVLNLYLDAEYQHNWRINRDQALDLSAQLFARYWPERSPDGAQRIDPAVWSDYKRDHSMGLRVAGNWRYRFWQDAQIRLGGRLITNEALYSVDQFAVQAVYQQYWKGLTAQLIGRHSWRFDDQDRQGASQQDSLAANVRWRAWQANGNEWYIGLGVTQDLTDNDTTLGLTLGFNHSDGRGMTDYLPSELAFRDLYRQQSAVQQEFDRLRPLTQSKGPQAMSVGEGHE